MSERSTDDLGFEHPPVPRMPPATLRVRLRTSPTIRLLLPSPLMAARAERKARQLWRERGASHAYALRTMQAVVAQTPRESELEQIAERHLVESEVWEALFWQPWRRPHVDARSQALLQATCGAERGTLLSACHLGPYYRKAKALVSLGIMPHAVAGDFFFEEPTNDYWGRRVARWRRGIPDVPLVRPRGSFAILAGALERHRTVLVYYDLPGSHETHFLGKPVMLADGTARLAVETDSVVLPLRSLRRGHRLILEANEPLDPRAFGGADELHEALADLHERQILEQPEAMADPADYGWGDGVGPQRWDRPSADADRAVR
jgi:lauroyl/myristoyl acyltransferase